MGFQDRDYYRESTPGSGVQSVVVRLIIVNGALFLANMFFGGGPGIDSITQALMLRGDAVAHPWMWYQFLTAGFVHDPGNLLHLVGNMIGLYFFGTQLERRLGGKEFLRFYLIAIVVGFVAWGLRKYFAGPASGACLGASGGVVATVILFCLFEPRAVLLVFGLIPMPAWLFGLLLVASDLFGVQPGLTKGQVAFDVHLTGAAFALAYWRLGWNFGRLPGMARLGRLLRSPQKWLQAKPPLKVHDPEQYYEDLDAEGDRLLIKVKQDGLDSLTPKERQALEDYSRRTRQKLR